MILLRGIPTKAFPVIHRHTQKVPLFCLYQIVFCHPCEKKLCYVCFDISSEFSYLFLAFLLVSILDIYWHSFWPLIFYCLPGRFPPGPQKHPIHMNLFQISMSKQLASGTAVFAASKRFWKNPPWMNGPFCIRELPKVNAELFTLAVASFFFPHPKQAQHRSTPRKASPMFWLHIPKCGTSFYNTVLHMPGACPGLGANVSIDDEQFGKCFETGFRKQ